jgi:4'-phosphopantetheinyl transferase
MEPDCCLKDSMFTIFFADSIQIGVDVMRLSDARHTTEDKRREFFRLMRRQFTVDEWKQIENPTYDGMSTISTTLGNRQLAAFFRHWSLKESYVKAVGSGLNIDLQRLNFKVSLMDSR